MSCTIAFILYLIAQNIQVKQAKSTSNFIFLYKNFRNWERVFTKGNALKLT